MNKVQIVVDSTVDLTPELVKENDLIVLPLHVAFKDDLHDIKMESTLIVKSCIKK